MSGRYSRNKGRRGEYALRDHLRALGFEAIRVPLSGASEGYKGDVVATRGEETITFELKCRKNAFSKLYWFANQANMPSGIVAADYNLISITTSPTKTNHYLDMTKLLLTIDPSIRKQVVRAVGQMVSLEKLKGTCDVLVVKDDRKPFLFLHYA